MEDKISTGYDKSDKQVYNTNESDETQVLFNKKIWRVRDVAKFLRSSRLAVDGSESILI